MFRLVVPLLFGLIGTAVLVGLGLWQLDRLGQKQEIIARIEAQMQQDAVPLPASPDPEADLYRAVTVSGTLEPREAHVLTSTRADGPGFRIVAAFTTDDGRRILLDRGFVPEALKTQPRPPGPATLTGNLVWPRETDIFTPDPDRANNIWFARDVDTMAAALNTEPVMVAARERVGANAPLPMPVTVNVPNNHLQYAVTWFLLAVVWAGMTVYFILRTRPLRSQQRAEPM